MVKTDFAGNAADGMIEADALALHAVSNRFQNGEAAVPFVQVQNAGCDAHGSEGAEASDAQQQFLADPDARISSIQTRGKFTVLGMIAFDVGVEQKQIAASDLHAPDFRADGSAAGFHLNGYRLAVRSDGSFHGQLIDIGLDIFFLLPAGAIEALAEVSLAIKQSHGHQRNTQIGRALDVIAGQHAEAAGVFGNGNVQTEFGGEVSHRTRPQNAGVPGSPGTVSIEILALAAIGIINSAVQHQLAGAPFHHGQRNLRKQGDGIVIELPPANRIEVAKQAAGVMVPTPPKIARQRPQTFLGGSDKAVQSAGFAYHRADLGRSLAQHSDFILAKNPRRNRSGPPELPASTPRSIRGTPRKDW